MSYRPVNQYICPVEILDMEKFKPVINPAGSSLEGVTDIHAEREHVRTERLISHSFTDLTMRRTFIDFANNGPSTDTAHIRSESVAILNDQEVGPNGEIDECYIVPNRGYRLYGMISAEHEECPIGLVVDSPLYNLLNETVGNRQRLLYVTMYKFKFHGEQMFLRVEINRTRSFATFRSLSDSTLKNYMIAVGWADPGIIPVNLYEMWMFRAMKKIGRA